MYSDEIVVTTYSQKSKYMEDIIDSNADFLNSLFKVKMKKNEVSQEAMQSYYVDLYYQIITKDGFSHFMLDFYFDKNLITHIEHALYNLNCHKNLYLFNQVIHYANRLNKLENIHSMLELECEYKEKRLFDFFTKKFKSLQTQESLITKNYFWLLKHPQLTSIQEHNIKDKLLEVHLNILDQYKSVSTNAYC